MKTLFKFELGALAIFAVLVIFSRMNILPNFIHLFAAVHLAMYFFPIRLVLKKEPELKALPWISSFVISASVCLISIMTVYNEKNEILLASMTLFALINLIGIFYYFSKNSKSIAWLHVAAQATLTMYFF